MRQIFETRALRKRHQSGDKQTPIVVLSPPLRLTLGFGVVLASVGVLWSVLARIPIEVNGTGVLLPVGVINNVRAAVDGRARWTFADSRFDWADEALRFQREPESLSNAEVMELSRSILRSYASSQSRQRLSSDAVMPGPTSYAQGTLLMWLQSLQEQEALQSQLDTLTSVAVLTRFQQKTLAEKQRILQKELTSRQAFFDSMQSLAKKGYVSKPTLLQNQAQVDNLESRVFSNQDSLAKLQAQLEQSYIKLRQTLAQMISNGLVFADHDVYIRQVVPNDGEGVSKGDSLLLLSRESLANPARVPVFLSARESAQVNVGMPVLVTPVGMRRSEVGGIQGRVVQLAELPSGEQELEARLGVSELASVIRKREPSPTLAVVELERDAADQGDNRAGYVWNSRGDLPFAPKTADQLTVAITTRHVAPIALVIPRLRRWFGIVPPETRDGTEEILGQPSASNPSATQGAR